MPFHGRSWDVFLARRGVADGRRRRSSARPPGRTGTEIMRELFGPLERRRGVGARAREGGRLPRALRAGVPRDRRASRHSRAPRAASGIRLACATAGDADEHRVRARRPRHGRRVRRRCRRARRQARQARAGPVPARRAARRRRRASTALVFEDAPLGIEGARRAGMHAVADHVGRARRRARRGRARASRRSPTYRDLAPRERSSTLARRADARVRRHLKLP